MPNTRGVGQVNCSVTSVIYGAEDSNEKVHQDSGHPQRLGARIMDQQLPSPFIEGTAHQWAWDSTSLSWFKECPRKYQYHMLEGWRTRAESVHLEFGILYHEALEVYDTNRHIGFDHDQSLFIVVKGLLIRTWRDGRPWRASKDLPIEDKASLKCRENLIRTVVWYLDKFRDDPAKTRVHPSSGTPMVELHFQFEIGAGVDLSHPYSLCGYLDRVVEFQGQPFVMDRKTTTS